MLAAHPAVADCAVIGVPDEIKGQVPRGLVVLKDGASADGLADELVAAVRNEIGAVACFKLVDVVAALPKTRSGKIIAKDDARHRRGQGRTRAVDYRGPRGAPCVTPDSSAVSFR